MARKVKVGAVTFSVSTVKENGHPVWVDIMNEDGNTTLGSLKPNGDGYWTMAGTSGRYGADKDLNVAVRRWTRMLANRSLDNEATRALADSQDWDWERRAKQARERERAEAKQERERLERRANNPAVVVVTCKEFLHLNGYSKEPTLVERPAEVCVYGERWGSVRLSLAHGLSADSLYTMTVSCSSISGSSQDAREYAAVLMRAADEAETWNKVTLPALRAQEVQA